MWFSRNLSAMICAALVVALFGAGCGGGGGGVSSTPGRAFKGPVAGGEVRVYRLDESGAAAELLESVTTDGDGRFLIQAEYTYPILLSLTGGTFIDEADGETYELPTGLSVDAILPSLMYGESVAVTPLTHFAAYQVPHRIAAGESVTSAIANGALDIAYKFGISDVDLLHTIPIDLTDPDETIAAGLGSRAERIRAEGPSQFVGDACGPGCKYGLALAALSVAITDLNDSQYSGQSERRDVVHVISFILGPLFSNGLMTGGPLGGNGGQTGGNFLGGAFPSAIDLFLAGLMNQSGLWPGQGGIMPSNGGGAPPVGGSAPTPRPTVTPTPVGAPPSSRPTITKVTACDGAASLTWTEVAGADNYLVSYSPSLTGSASTTQTTNTSVALTPLVNGATYYVEVIPRQGTTTGPTSAMVSVTPTGVSLFTFPDNALDTCVKSAMSAQGAISLAAVTTLTCPGAGIADLTGMNLMTGLTNIDFSTNVIIDTSPLATLTQLKTVNLSSNEMIDVTPLAPLVNVTTLDLSFNHIYQGVPTFAAAPFTSNPAIDMSENTYLYCGMAPAMYTLTCGELTTLITNVGARGGAVTPAVATPGLNCDWGVMVCGCADIPPAPGC